MANGAAKETPQEVKDAVSVVRNRRTDAMFVVACLFVAWIVYLVVYEDKIGEFAQGVCSTVLGMFLRELGSMYSFETGTTRSGAKKDEAIAKLTENAATVAASAPAITAAAVAAATGTTSPLPPNLVTPAEKNPVTGVTPAAEVAGQPSGDKS